MDPILRQFKMMLPLLAVSLLASTVLARETVYIEGTGLDGETRQLDVSRYPALYTGDFDDCMGGESLFNVTKFDAAYYADNLTVLFHLDGTTNIRRESVIMHIAIDVYGENRFNMTYDPCSDGSVIDSLCPMNASVPIEALAIIPISSSDIDTIPSIALGIPDLEGYARLLIFANSTQTQIGCFQAAMTNGNTLSQPQYVGSIIGGFTFVAVVASFLTAIYGVKITSMRTHYAHSFSVLVIFETLHSIFLSGALSVNWPSVLPAWWSNFAWSAGMIADDRIIRSISGFTGNNGNISQVGGAGPVPINNEGGLVQDIYGRSLDLAQRADLLHHSTLARRAEYNASNPYDYTWSGDPRTPGMPMPGTWPGFGGTLSSVNVPYPGAFTLAIIWLLVILGAVVLFIVAAKLLLDLLIKTKLLKTDGFDYFRSHLPGYIVVGVLRTLFIAFFAIMTLAMYQFSLGGPAGPLAVSVVVWGLLFLGVGGTAGYAWYVRFREGKFEWTLDTLRFESGKLFKVIPFVTTIRASKIGEDEREVKPRLYGSITFHIIKFTPNDPDRKTVHQDEAYIKRFGWLSARYRRTRWWFFTVYLGYQFIRACFIGAASHSPLVQVFGLFVFEIFALTSIMKVNPFEGARNTAVAVYMLSISKIITAAISIAFIPDFAINRTVATVLGLIVVVVQGFLTVAVLVLVVLGMVSSWMSLSRNREQFFKYLDPIRITYYQRMKRQAEDLPGRRGQAEEEPELDTTGQTFNVRDVRRAPKIEDEVEDVFGEIRPTSPMSPILEETVRRSRANSASSRYSVSSLPRGARAHRASWSSRDFAQWDAEMSRTEPNHRLNRARSSSLRMQALTQRNGAISPAGGQVPMRPMTPTREHSMELPSLTIRTDLGGGTRKISEEKIDKEDGLADDEKKRASGVSSTVSEVNEKRAASQHSVSPLTPTDYEKKLD